jgi:SEC-C motif-containing protein
MRSRFAAYALALLDYIIATTHPDGPEYQNDVLRWRMQLAEFSRTTSFVGLQVLSNEDSDSGSVVSFRAELTQGEQDASFAERSLFVRHEGRWLYHSGERFAWQEDP